MHEVDKEKKRKRVESFYGVLSGIIVGVILFFIAETFGVDFLIAAITILSIIIIFNVSLFGTVLTIKFLGKIPSEELTSEEIMFVTHTRNPYGLLHFLSTFQRFYVNLNMVLGSLLYITCTVIFFGTDSKEFYAILSMIVFSLVSTILLILHISKISPELSPE